MKEEVEMEMEMEIGEVGGLLEIFICSGFFPRTVAFSRRGGAGLGYMKGMGKGRVG